MAGKTTTTLTLFSQKKLLGKAHTSNLKLDGNEPIGSAVQLASSRIFGEAVPTNPSLTLNVQQGVGVGAKTVEYVDFDVVAISGTTYNATSTGGGAGSDSGESSQSSGPHGYQLQLKSTYETDTDDNRSKAGNGVFDNSKVLHQTLGALQIVPTSFSGESDNPYVVRIYKNDGNALGPANQIGVADNIDWQIDTFNGVLFVQDFDSTKIDVSASPPLYARAFIYVGDMLDDVVTAGGGGGGGTPGGSNTQVQFNDGGSFGGDADLTYNKTTNTLQSAGFITASLGFSGSLTRLSNGKSYIKEGSGIKVTSSSNGSITLKTSKELIFNEILGGNANGSNTYFTFTNTPFSPDDVSVFVNGQLQVPNDKTVYQDYSVTGSHLYFTTGSVPEQGSLVMAIYNKVVS